MTKSNEGELYIKAHQSVIDAIVLLTRGMIGEKVSIMDLAPDYNQGADTE